MRKRLLCLLLALILLALPCVFAAGRVSLYVGDAPFSEDALYPLIETEEDCFLPVRAFAELAGLTVKRSEMLGSLLLVRGDAYLSYDLAGGTVRNERDETKRTTVRRFGGELYLAAKEVCPAMGLTFETDFDATGTLCGRLTDGSESRTFAELRGYLSGISDADSSPILLRVPNIRTVQGTFLYPMLLRPAADSVPALIRLLGDHHATFVLSPGDIRNYKSVLPSVYAAGHTVAFYLDASKKSAADLDAFRAAAEDANTVLSALCGETVRVYVSAAAYTSIPKLEGYFAKSCLLHLVTNDLKSERMTDLVLSESPAEGLYNFSIASDPETRGYYTAFWKKFDTYTELRAMSVSETGATR